MAFVAVSPVGSTVTRSSVFYNSAASRRDVFQSRRRCLVMHGTSEAPPASERRPGSRKGFVEEMRFVAMRLHTKDQAPSEGQQEESAIPIQEWRPTQKDYLQFLVDSKHVYDYMEGKIAESSDPSLSMFKESGLERGKALADDIQWFETQGIKAGEPTSRAKKYVEYLEKLTEDSPKEFLCHWYNYYFAHSAGGRMIGRMMSNLLFDGKTFNFYEWDRDVKEILGEVREKIDKVAAEWSREEKDACLEETSLAFAYSGTVLANLAKAE